MATTEQASERQEKKVLPPQVQSQLSRYETQPQTQFQGLGLGLWPWPIVNLLLALVERVRARVCAPSPAPTPARMLPRTASRRTEYVRNREGRIIEKYEEVDIL